MDSKEEREYLTVVEAARMLSISDSTIRNMMRGGTLPYFKVGLKKGYRVRRSDLIAFVERSEGGANA